MRCKESAVNRAVDPIPSSALNSIAIMAIALEAPKATGRAISHWTAEKSKLTAFLESKSDGFRLHFFKKRCFVHTRTPPHAARG
jgi:hypothetical protein